MNELRTHLSFIQLRFHCSKQQGRTFHVTTAANNTGEAVVQYFSGQTDVQPDACGSFVRMENDNSRLAERCRQWGFNGASYYIGKWGMVEIKIDYIFPVLWNEIHITGSCLQVTQGGNVTTFSLECLLVIFGKSLFAKIL